ncbi:hypothetical protein RCH14_001999 [Massilia sp. MP_M2]|uniref:hypothetical protein n=1 Tax=Massilia sp. MP_M2 TaxID=3071713 RepID=UPI00319E8AA3
MVSSISSSTATQATYAPAARKTPDETVATPGPVATTDDQDRAAAPTQSAESAASARLGEQLNAQADASRVQRAVDEAGSDTATATGSEAASEAAAGAGTEAAAAPTGGAAPAAASTATSATSSTTNDYVAEADTDSDKTVSDDEQAAYDTKLRQQAEAAAATKAAAAKGADPQAALSAEVRATYGVEKAAEPALSITA